MVERVVAGTNRRDSDCSLRKPLRLAEGQYRQMTSELLDVVNRYAFVSESPAPAGDEDQRPHWQLALAASRADPAQDLEFAIRNLKPTEAM